MKHTDSKSAKKKKISDFPEFFIQKIRKSENTAYFQALKITVLFFLISSLWIIMSDKVVGALFTDRETLVNVNIIKGWLYVFIISVMIFRLISVEIRKVVDSKKKTDQINITLEKSNTLFSAILESSPEIMVFSIDKEYKYTAFNNRHKYYMQTLWKHEIQLGDNILDIINLPENSRLAKINFDRALSGEYFTQMEEISSSTDPLAFWQKYFSPIFDRDKSVIGLTCFDLNITALKRAQQKNQYLSYHDSLTGLYNRRFYEEAITRIDRPENYPISIIMADVNGLKLVNDAFGHKVGDELLKRASEAIIGSCRNDDIAARWGGDEFIILLPKTDWASAKSIVEKTKTISSGMRVNSVNVDISFGWATKASEDDVISIAIKDAEDIMYKNKIIESKSMRSHTINMIMNTLHEKNPREEEHSVRVGEICRKIGTAMHMSDIDINTLTLVGFLHDIGKIAIEEGILNKPGRLTDPEFESVKQHPEIGCRIIRSSYEISEVAEAVLYHHERWDGNGYPKGLSGKDIPMFARIISIADSFDAMTSIRTYRNTWSREKAVEEIIRCSGKQYDPEIVKVFVEDVLKLAESTDLQNIDS